MEQEHAGQPGPECPLQRAMNRKLGPGKMFPNNVVEALRNELLPQWGLVPSRAFLEANQARAVRSTEASKRITASNSGLQSMLTTHASTRKSVPSHVCWTELQQCNIRDLHPFEVARGQVLHCTIIADPAPLMGVLLLAEDARGDVVRVQLYNQFPNGLSATNMAEQVRTTFAAGAKLSIAEPFLKVAKDGVRGIRVDSAADVRMQSLGPRTLSSMKQAGNDLTSRGQFSCARQEYLQALNLPEVDEIVTLLGNRSQAFLEELPVQACLDAAAALMLRPSHSKSWMRYAAALQGCAQAPEVDKDQQRRMLAVAQRAASVSSGESAPTTTREDLRLVWSVLLAGFADCTEVFQRLQTFSSEFSYETA